MFIFRPYVEYYFAFQPNAFWGQITKKSSKDCGFCHTHPFRTQLQKLFVNIKYVVVSCLFPFVVLCMIYNPHRESYPSSSLNRLANVCIHKQYSTGKRFYLPTKLQFSIIQYKPKNFLFLSYKLHTILPMRNFRWNSHCQKYTNEIVICLCEINHMVK